MTGISVLESKEREMARCQVEIRRCVFWPAARTPTRPLAGSEPDLSRYLMYGVALDFSVGFKLPVWPIAQTEAAATARWPRGPGATPHLCPWGAPTAKQSV